MSADELAAAVEAMGALPVPVPVPVAPEPQALSVERLAEIEVRERAAFAGPWYTDTCTEHDGSTSTGVVTASDAWIVPLQDLDPDDAEFMAHARADVPALVAEVRRQAARIAELERTVQQMVDGLNGHDCPPPGETPMGAVTRFSVRLMEAERLAAELQSGQAADGSYLPALPWAALLDDEDLDEFLADLTASIVGHDGVTALAEIERTCGTWRLVAEAQHGHNTAPGPDALTVTFSPVASLREPDGEFYGLVHHDWRIGRDLPEMGGA